MVRGCLVVTLFFGLASGCKDPVPTADQGLAVGSDPTPSVGPAKVSRWGLGVDARAPALEARELEREPGSLPAGSDARTAWAQGRIGGPHAVDALAAWLEGEAGATSAHLAALALLDPPPGEPNPEGNGRWSGLEDAVWTRLAVTEAPDEIEALLLAVARLGGERSQARLSVMLEGDAKPAHGAALEVMGMLCARGHAASTAGLEVVAKQLVQDAPHAWAAAYAVGRCAGPSAELLAGAVRGTLVERMTPALQSADPALARVVWKAFAGLGEIPAEVPADVLGHAPPEWMVEVEAVRALAGHADGRSVLVERLTALQPGAFQGPRVHVLLVALRGLRDAVVGTPELLSGLSPLRLSLKSARDRSQGRRRKALTLALCESELLAAIGSGDLAALRACGEGIEELPEGHAEVLEIEALLRVGVAMTREAKAQALLQRAADARPSVAAAALAALVDVDQPRVGAVLQDGLGRLDPGVKAAAAATIAIRARDRARRDESALPMLKEAVTSWPNSTTIEARIAAIEALGNLARSGGKDESGALAAPWLRETVLPLANDPAVAIRRAGLAALQPVPELAEAFVRALPGPRPAPFVDGLKSRLAEFGDVTGLRVTTSAGAMTITFEGPAAINQATVASLAAGGFYDGLTFHRVVPGFVIQGGDPRGDGYGGPGFLVPCEWSSQKYERGVVGMALAGKDTGGSQFFIAQAREPRLDARYTILGRVTDGLEVLDEVLPHDKIMTVEVLGRDG
ncbi:MAG: peptidylprolyl isomerase [Nannocystaceae bacterium]|nr:peptidylprolyl isomerase [Nannocystaceae bacterium]